MTSPELASTPAPPYTAVIFTSIHAAERPHGYPETAALMAALVARQPGFLGAESARAELGITVSYWRSAQDARAWKAVADHVLAQRLGRERWYSAYRVRIATVEREYGVTPD